MRISRPSYCKLLVEDAEDKVIVLAAPACAVPVAAEPPNTGFIKQC